MKTLGLAFVIVAIVGFIVYLLFGYLLKAEGLAGAFAGLVFGTLPFIHQELEKRAAKKAVPAVPPAQMPNAAQSFQPPANAQSPSAPDWWQVSSGQATPPLSQSTSESRTTNPVPVYVPYVPTTSIEVSPSQPQPVGPDAARPAPSAGLSTGSALYWVVLLVYGIAIVIAVRGASIVAGRLFYRWYESQPDSGADFVFNVLGSWLPLLIVAVGVFLVGLWIGLKSPRNGWLITLGAVVIGLLIARLINGSGLVNFDETNVFLEDYLLPHDEASVAWRFDNPGEYERLYQTLSWAFIFGMVVIESVVALVGWWLGARLGRSRIRSS